jgi:D-lactate dehydrogenase (cytochrome)
MRIKKNSDIISYLEDTSNIQGKASALYLPANEKELSFILAQLVAAKTPVTVSGSRTGTTAGCVPLEGAIISLEAFPEAITIDQANNRVSAAAAVTLERLQAVLAASGLSLLAAPTESLASLGGSVNTAASGVRGFGYGSIRKYVTGLRVLLTTGQVLSIDRGRIKAKGRDFSFQASGRNFKFSLPDYQLPAVKSQAGYYVADDMDLIDLFIGSEGTLGIITAVELKVARQASFVFDGLTFFTKDSQAFDFVEIIKKAAGRGEVSPVALEFFDANSLAMLKGRYDFIPQAQAAIYFEQTAPNKKRADLYLEAWHDLLSGSAALLDKSLLADTLQEREKIFAFRHALPQMINEFLRQYKQIKVSSDIAVPDKFLRCMYEFYSEKGKVCGIPFVNFGHIGENHLHFNFLPRNFREYEKAKQYMRLFCEKGISLGGTVSAEHGIGKIKKPYARLMFSEKDFKQMAVLKKYFDPHCLLGRDNIFDKELL